MSLRQQAASGIKWTTFSAALTTFAQLAQRVILARLLLPEQFGLYGMLLPVIAFGQAFADMGISQAIIQRQDASADELSSLYWLNVLAGAVVFVLVLLSAPLVVAYYNEPRLNDLFAWVALVFIITPLGQQFQMLLQKALRFDTIARIEIVSVLAGSLFSVLAAALGAGVLAILWGLLLSALLRALALMQVGWRDWRPALHFRLGDTRSYLRFGLFQMGDRLLNMFASNIDYIIIGGVLGRQALGYYTMAFQLVVLPYQRLNPILTRVAFPLFAKRQQDTASLRRGYLEITRLIAFMIFPVMVGLALTAPLAVPLLLGDQWLPAVPVLQILSVLGIMRGLANPFGAVYLALGKAEVGFYFNIALLLVNFIVFRWAVQYGIEALALCFVGTNLLFLGVTWAWLYRLIALPLLAYLRQLWLPALCAVGMALAVLAADLLLRPLLPAPLLLALLVLVGAGVYAALGWWRAGGYFRELLRLLRGRGAAA